MTVKYITPRQLIEIDPVAKAMGYKRITRLIVSGDLPAMNTNPMGGRPRYLLTLNDWNRLKSTFDPIAKE